MTVSSDSRPPLVLIFESHLLWRSVITRSLEYKFPDAVLRETIEPRQMVTMLNDGPNLAILDADLPGVRMDVFLKKMATEPVLAHIPRLVMHNRPGANPHLGETLRHATQALSRPFDIKDFLGRVEFLLRQSLGKRPLNVMPRSAIRRSIRETAHVMLPITCLDGRDILTPAPEQIMDFEEVDCDFQALFQALQAPAGSAPVRCRIRRSERAPGMMTLRPINLAAAQTRSLDAITENKGLVQITDLLPQAPQLGFPARMVNLSFSGVQLESPIAFAQDQSVRLSLRRFLSHLFTPCKQDLVTCRCVRVRPEPHHFELGLHMEDAGPDLTAAILHWASSGGG